MKTTLKNSLILISLLLLFGCSSRAANDSDNPLYEELKYGDKTVDIWNSVNYEIIKDQQVIRKVEPSVKDESILVNILVRISNNGSRRADTFKLNIIESTPLKYTHASGHEGINHGYLDKHDEYELYRYYIFKSIEDAEEFIAKTNIKIEWNENEEITEQYIKLPSKPFR